MDPEFATVFAAADINVVSFASNHTLDWGEDAMLDTIAMFEEWGIAVIGAGMDREQAHRPYVYEKNGASVGILAYCSVIRDGWAAGDGKPGVSAVRAKTWYETVDFQPGCPPLVRSAAHPGDVEAMQHDIAALKSQVQTVIVSMHWGLHYLPKVIAEYERPLAQAAFEAGADVIVGHHPHMIKAWRPQTRKVCMYSIGNMMTTGGLTEGNKPRSEWNIVRFEPAQEGLYQFPDECRKALIARITTDEQGLIDVSGLPVNINDLAVPIPVGTDAEAIAEFTQHVEWLSDFLPHAPFSTRGDAVNLWSRA